MQQGPDIDTIKDMLKARIVEVCHRCLPRGRRDGNEWVAHNPFVDEQRKTPALKVALTGNKGAWKDYRHPTDKGDVLKLIEFTQSLASFKEVVTWAKDFLGLEQMTPKQREALRHEAVMRKQRDEEEDRKRRQRKLEQAMALWQEADGPGENPGAEAHAMGYFASRGCDPRNLLHPSFRTFRFSSATEWWKGAEFQHANGGQRKVKPGPQYPAIHSAMRAANGALTCCHVTYLDPVLRAKAPVAPPKLMRGEALGSVIEVARGPSEQDFWMCAVAGPLIIAEGIETALSLALAVPEARVWAAGSLAGLGACPVQLPCVGEIALARDNNEGNAQAQKALRQAVLKLEEADKPLVVMASHVGDDFNDLTQGD
jgi:hypothetical protein